MAGYGKRLGAATAGAESASFLGPLRCRHCCTRTPDISVAADDISQRLAYAASRVLIGRSDSGRSVINTSLILSEFVQAADRTPTFLIAGTVPGTIENALTAWVRWRRPHSERVLADIVAFMTRHESAPVIAGMRSGIAVPSASTPAVETPSGGSAGFKPGRSGTMSRNASATGDQGTGSCVLTAGLMSLRWSRCRPRGLGYISCSHQRLRAGLFVVSPFGLRCRYRRNSRRKLEN